jgi:hypothetical protein
MAKPMIRAVSGRKYTSPGYLADCTFKDIAVTGVEDNFRFATIR